MKGYVYILKCSDNSYYKALLIILKREFMNINLAKVLTILMKKLPVEVVFVSEFPKYYDALIFEKQVKGWSKKKKEALIDGNFDFLPKLAECKNESHFKTFENDSWRHTLRLRSGR